ncbi:helix-turn-helix domain-containing protein [Gordonia amarae]|uniref:Helix-turn-helix domain-containing protein n=2 Tax=Gordonia amarae TaxID=36821 RepID=A0A857KJ19_9ACTN|nr:helix-turn-helix domain-containing protein [Gordonia amarae]MCS3878675.1 AraC-like DNA-binding protein [Gordonia amarae]QHN17266.1 helix-turn-helix domain-containing protein [Gordonia amarae]QHN21792.1 helix-turn-helix domain-containing protein [Gordonia amarae]QHN30643.1 helix-turn-helix domain-containing protein [Gordonia amarae]QHN39420.1 helix-turn-helix domain-containing protein [Gordonia amarae]
MTAVDTGRAQSLRGLTFDEWCEGISTTFVPLKAEPDAGTAGSFRGGLADVAVGDLRLSEVAGGRVRVRRSAATIKRADPGVIKVGVQLSGHSVVRQRDREALLGPGDIAVYDTSERYELAMTDPFSMLVAVVPRSALRVNESELRSGTVRTVASASGTGALLMAVLSSLRHQFPDRVTGSAPPESPLIADAVADLVSATVRAHVPGEPLGCADTITVSARAYIERHLADPELCPAAVAAKHHVSVRYLQRLFATDGQTVAGYIRRRRLERCHSDLADPSLRHRGVAAIGATNGLPAPAHFSRLFKTTYGMTPGEYRERIRVQYSSGRC